MKPGGPRFEDVVPTLAAPSTRRGPHTLAGLLLQGFRYSPASPSQLKHSKNRLSHMLRQAAPCQLCPSPIMCHAPQARRPACLPEEVQGKKEQSLEYQGCMVPRTCWILQMPTCPP